MDCDNYPRFMEGVREVRRLSAYRTRWTADYGGTREEWYSRITGTTTNRRIAWTSESGDRNDGEVILEPLDRERTRVYFATDYEPHGLMGSSAERFRLMERRIDGDLKRFKGYVEGEPMPGEGLPSATRRAGGMGEGAGGQARQTLAAPRLNALEWLSAGITTLGAVDVGIVGLFDFNPIAAVLGRRSLATRVIYGMIGASAAYTLFGLVRADAMSRRTQPGFSSGRGTEQWPQPSAAYRHDGAGPSPHDPSEFDQAGRRARGRFA
jgi:uncharacterized membrane protein YuzA (DUF378 family)